MSFQARASHAVGITCLVILIAILTMAIHRARIAAMKMSSSNNLKQTALGLHNFESAFKRLPTGCDAEAKHGWMTRVQPFMESSNWYDRVYMDLVWDDPGNAYKFFMRMRHWERPNEPELFSEEGFGLTHYMANPAVLHRESSTRFSEIEAGLSNVWFAGEVSGEYQPFGYPFNWRPLTWPLNDGQGGYGAWSDGAQFCMGDGSIRMVSSQIDRTSLEILSQRIPLPENAKVEVPERIFRTTSKSNPRKVICFANQQDDQKTRRKGDSASCIYFGKDEQPEVAVLAGPRDERTKVGITIETILEQYPNIKVLDYGKVLDDEATETIAMFHELETLVVGGVDLTERGIRKIASLQKLESIFCIQGNEQAIQGLRNALPNCDVTVRGK